jgi:hypothetical protein
VTIKITVETRINSYGQQVNNQTERQSRDGFVAFFPVPATAKIECEVDRLSPISTANVLLAAPSLVTLYTESHFLNPRRDFLTNPHDTITFTAGLITGHKFTGQSAAKTVIDTITAPIRAIMPSVSVTQSTTVQSTGASSHTTSTTASP